MEESGVSHQSLGLKGQLLVGCELTERKWGEDLQ